MGSISGEGLKPHAVCIPFPAQGHINPMLKLAKILNHKGFHITFVNSEFNHRRLLRSRGPESVKGLPSFRFETIPDGLPPSEVDATQDIASLCEAVTQNCLGPFKDLIARLNESGPPVSCIVSDGGMFFTLDAAEEFGIPEILFWSCGAGGFLGFVLYRLVIDKGYSPLKDSSYLENGYLETVLDWAKGMPGVRLRDLPSFIRTTNPDDPIVKYIVLITERAKSASAIMVNTFDALEQEALNGLQSMLPPVYAAGPFQFFEQQVEDSGVRALGLSLWKEDTSCVEWLNTNDPNSVVYVNFGSITVMTADQLVEFAWGLANSKKPFLWIIRPDLVSGEEAVLPREFVEETRERGMLASWCPQEQVISHPAVGGFLTHSGWNSTLESICSGVPMICWPFFADQQTNCWYCCTQWGIGMEIDTDVKRHEVERLVRELMGGEKGHEMRRKAMELKKLAKDAATSPTGSSYNNMEEVINKFLSPN
nr:7-deoxyloganetin glucosyltransferase-like [Ipomoea batatas]